MIQEAFPIILLLGACSVPVGPTLPEGLCFPGTRIAYDASVVGPCYSPSMDGPEPLDEAGRGHGVDSGQDVHYSHIPDACSFWDCPDTGEQEEP